MLTRASFPVSSSFFALFCWFRVLFLSHASVKQGVNNRRLLWSLTALKSKIIFRFQHSTSIFQLVYSLYCTEYCCTSTAVLTFTSTQGTSPLRVVREVSWSLFFLLFLFRSALIPLGHTHPERMILPLPTIGHSSRPSRSVTRIQSV